MVRIIFIGLLLYLAYKLIFGFIIPVYKTTRQVKKGFNDMQEKMNEQNAQKQPNNHTSSNGTMKKEKAGDYIDFEEIK